MLPLHYNDSFDMRPAVAHICHRLHYVQINHINNFFIINSINRLNDFKISLLRYVPHPRTYPSLITFVALPKCHWVVSIHLPDAEVISALPLLVWYVPHSLNAFPSHISVTSIFWCVHLPTYHRVVSINRPSGYEPDALPLRHDDFVCPHHTHINMLIVFK